MSSGAGCRNLPPVRGFRYGDRRVTVSGMTMTGMDVELVSGVATQLDGQAAAIGAAAADVDRLVDSAVSQWFGADAQKFVQEWQAQHRPALVTALQALAQLSATAKRNVAEQQLASGAGGEPRCSTVADGHLSSCAQTVTTGSAPKDVRGLLGLLPGAYTQPGGVSVTFIGAGAGRRAIVSVSGTEEWNFGGTNVDDMSTNLSNAFGLSNLKEQAIRQAMTDAGVTATDQVLLVGHSQGGADVINFAGDPANAKQFHITGVVTAGAPETVHYPAHNIPVMELRTDGDVVPMLGASSAAGLGVAGIPGAVIGHAIHDATAPGNVRVVDLPGGYEVPWRAHAIDNYIDDSGKATNPAVSDFVRDHAGFFGGQPATTYTYSAQRVGAGWVRYR